MRYFCLVLYYLLFRYLPSNSCFIKPLGRLSAYLRYITCKHIFKSCGRGVGIERLATFGDGKNIEIGDFSNLGINCSVPSDIKIGRDVMMGPNFTCYVVNHRYDRLDIPMNKQGTTPRTKLEIGNDVWIGRDVLLMPGGYIPNGAVVAARSVVTKKFPDYSVLGGVPAKVIKFRNS